MSLVYAIVEGPEKGWTSAQTIATFVLAAVLLVCFVVIEQRSKAPLVRLSIFRVRSLLTANTTMFLVGSGLFAMFFFNSLYIQRVLGYGPLKAGLAFLPFTFGIIVSAGLASRFAPRVGVRPVAIIGMVVTIAGMLYLTHIQANGTYAADVLPALLLTSLGMGAVFLPLTLIATTGLDNEDQGLASGLFNTSQQIGGALGLAILTSLAASKTASVQGVSQSRGARRRLPRRVPRRRAVHRARAGRVPRPPAQAPRGADRGRGRRRGSRSGLARGELLVHGLGPEPGAVLGGELLEGEPEHVGEGLDAPRAGCRRRRSAGPSSRATVVKAASSSPHAVIHCVNGAGSRSTLSA